MTSQEQFSGALRRHQKIETRLNEVIIALRGLANNQLEEQRKAAERKCRYDLIQQQRAELRQRIAKERDAVAALEAVPAEGVRRVKHDSTAGEGIPHTNIFMRANLPGDHRGIWWTPGGRPDQKREKTAFAAFNKSLILLKKLGAGEGIRTLDPNLGKVVLYP